MIWWMWTLAAAMEPATDTQEAALRAVNLDRGPDEMRGTPQEQQAAWRAACRQGWRPACNPTQWEPTCQDESDPVSCLTVGWQAERAGNGPLARKVYGNLCTTGFARACTDLARLGASNAGRLHEDACDAKIGASCRAVGRGTEACRLGDAIGCLAAKELQRSCTLGHAPGCVAWAASLEEDRGNARQLIDATQRACDLGDAPGCTDYAALLLRGSGAPADAEAASRLWWTVCEQGHGPACARLAWAILQEEAEGVAMAPRALYERGCELGDEASCDRVDRFSSQQRRKPVQFFRDLDVKAFGSPMFRPFLGGSFAAWASLSIPKVGRLRSRRRLDIQADLGELDYTFGASDAYAMPQNHSFVAGTWEQDGAPIGFLVGVGYFSWSGAPYFGDATAWPTTPSSQDTVSALVLRADVAHEQLFGDHSGVRLSVSRIDPGSGSHNRLTLGFEHDRDAGGAFVMEAGKTDVSAWAGLSGSGEPQGVGAVFSGLRAMPLARGPGGHPLLSLVLEGLVATRLGSVPTWLEHHAPARLGPDIGVWSLLKGHAPSRFAGEGLGRGTAEIRWSVGEYHGLRRPLEVYLLGFGEVAAVQRSLLEQTPIGVFGDAGAGAVLTWGSHSSVRADLALVPQEGTVLPRFGLVLEQVLRPW